MFLAELSTDFRWCFWRRTLKYPGFDKDRRRNNCRLPDVEHVDNVPGTMESCPTYFCLSPKLLTSLDMLSPALS